MKLAIELPGPEFLLPEVVRTSTDPRVKAGETARCAGDDPEQWFPFPSQPFEYAYSVCAECPIRQACRGYAEGTKQTGVWGGVDYDRGRPVRTYDELGLLNVA